MSIQSIIGNGLSSVGHGVGEGLNQVSTYLENLLSGATAQLSSLWDGGFVGMNTANASVLSDAIEQYIAKLNEIVDGFNTAANIDVALKGEAASAATEYVTAIKSLLQAYTSTYRNFNKLLTATVESMNEGDTQNASAIRTDAQDIQSQANSIRVD